MSQLLLIQTRRNTETEQKWTLVFHIEYYILRSSAWSKVNYLVNESDGAIDMHYAYLFTLQGGVTTHTQACAVLGYKFADLREAEGRWRP